MADILLKRFKNLLKEYKKVAPINEQTTALYNKYKKYIKDINILETLLEPPITTNKQVATLTLYNAMCKKI